MKITDLRVYLTRAAENRTWVFVEVDTDEGITGVGESTNSGGGGAHIVGRGYELLKDDLDYSDFADGVVGDDPNHIEMIWNKVYRRFGTLGSRGLGTTLCAGLDMALWDIKGKALGRPVYDLLGGPVRDDVRLYSHPASPDDIDACVADAKRQVAAGYKALKTDPFSAEMGKHHRRYIDGKISASGRAYSLDVMAALREAVGPDIELLIDAHGNFDVATATDLCNKMMPYDITWFEEPLQPESTEALEATEIKHGHASVHRRAQIQSLGFCAGSHRGSCQFHHAGYLLERWDIRNEKDGHPRRVLLHTDIASRRQWSI